MSGRGRSAGSVVLLTGASGFVGKVVLAELLRRRDALGIDAIHLVIRKAQKRDGTVRSAQERFDKEIVRAKVFAGLPPAWRRLCVVHEADLSRADAGLSKDSRRELAEVTTHLINCAASIDFDLPVREAADANIASALNVLELAKASASLRVMVDLSTAYVTPWREDGVKVPERLVHLPRPASELYRAIRDGRDEEELLAETHHPNTYTYTKCLAEHLLAERRGNVPLVIVRPSVISASWREPFPAWIDSGAAFAAYALYTGLGYLRAFPANPATRLDIVPVDEVSRRVVDAAFVAPPPKSFRIFHVAAGLERSARMDMTRDVITRYFDEHPAGRRPSLDYMDPPQYGFAAVDLVRRRLPMMAMRALALASGGRAEFEKVDRLDDKLKYICGAFHYFTNRQFDFETSEPLDEAFEPAAYVRVVCQGIYEHLLARDEAEVTFAGRRESAHESDLTWAARAPERNLATKSMAYLLRKGLRACTTQVTYDRPSFERAIAAAPDDSVFVLAPTHRSYLDFLLASYLFFDRPELGVPVPHIAAASEFSKVTLLGGLFAKSQAFYVQRGAGVSADVSRLVHELVHAKKSIMFFVEGQRSRSRQFLPPKRGLLRALQASGRTCLVLPIAIAYDRVPEEAVFEEELRGVSKPEMTLSGLLRWCARAARGHVQLGRVHLACGEPLVLDARSDVSALALRIVAEQQKELVATTFHLRCFLARHPSLGLDEKTLRAAIRSRGGKVVDSDLAGEADPSGAIEQTLRHHWMHWFFDDARARFKDHPAIAHHMARHSWMEAAPALRALDPRLDPLLEALFEPVCTDYALVARELAKSGAPLTPQAILKAFPSAHLPHVAGAFAALLDGGVLREANGLFEWGDRRDALEALRHGFAFPREPRRPTELLRLRAVNE